MRLPKPVESFTFATVVVTLDVQWGLNHCKAAHNFVHPHNLRLLLNWSWTHSVPEHLVSHNRSPRTNSPGSFGPQDNWSPWTIGPQKFGPHGQMVPKTIGPPGQLVPKHLVPMDKWSPGQLVPLDKWSPNIWSPWTNGPPKKLVPMDNWSKKFLSTGGPRLVRIHLVRSPK